MNDNTYAECLVERKTPGYARMLKIMIIVMAALFMVAGLVINLLLIVPLILFFVYLFAIPNLFIEYEYTFIQDSITIDKIINRAKRKRIMEIEMNHIEIIAPEENGEVNYYLGNKNYRPVHFDSNEPGHKRYCMAHNNGGNSALIYIEPNEKMLKAMKYNYPRKVITD